jgi:hypothetical protein
VLLEVDQDAAGHLPQVGGLGEQTGKLLQLPCWELVQGASDVGLGRIAQHDQDQVVVPAPSAGQPGTAAVGGLLVA